jgi:SpoU rRNA methylase family enzyme
LTKERLDLESLSTDIKSGKKVVIVVSGSNSSFSRREMDMGVCRSLHADVDIGPAGTIAVILYQSLI